MAISHVLLLLDWPPCFPIEANVVRSPCFCSAVWTRLMPVPYSVWMIHIWQIERCHLPTLRTNHNYIHKQYLLLITLYHIYIAMKTVFATQIRPAISAFTWVAGFTISKRRILCREKSSGVPFSLLGHAYLVLHWLCKSIDCDVDLISNRQCNSNPS